MRGREGEEAKGEEVDMVRVSTHFTVGDLERSLDMSPIFH